MHELVIFAGEISLGTLNLDDTGPRVGKLAGNIRRSDSLLHRYNKNSLEIPTHRPA